MIQISNLTKITEQDIPKLLTTINPILVKRDSLYNTFYRRLANEFTLFSQDDENIKTALETYIADMTVGYFGGKEPKYVVNEQLDEEKRTIIQKIFKKIFNNKSYKKEMEILLRYITDYNDDSTEHIELVRDYMIKGGCYEIIYENENNEIVYSKLDALQTVAIYDYSAPTNLIGLVRTWIEKDVNGKTTTIVEITDINGTRNYSGNGTYKENKDKFKKNNWSDVPAIAMEQPDGLAIFESVISLIKAYERVIQNSRNTFQYNDDAKLKITGYSPQNALTITDTDENSSTYGETIKNPDRTAEDEFVLEAPVFYTPDKDGDISWVEKTVQDGALTTHKKTLIDLISMISGVPNITDLGFTSADNASAIDRKFFALEQKISIADKLFKKGYLRRWELIFARINLKKQTTYDFRDVQVKLYRNLPTDKYTEIDTALKQRGLLSDETVISILPNELDPISELQKKRKQDEETMQDNVINVKMAKNEIDEEENINNIEDKEVE